MGPPLSQVLFAPAFKAVCKTSLRLRVGFGALSSFQDLTKYTDVGPNGTALPKVEVVCPGRWVWCGVEVP